MSDMLLAKWVDCYMGRARELAHTDLPAAEAAHESFARCDKEREEWVRAQGDSIRYAAEHVASGAESDAFPIVIGLIQDIRSNKANTTGGTRGTW
jgi:hypothetical protein